jgi:predicted AlkP superfamily pyrophosphatase or phosphodiesterase
MVPKLHSITLVRTLLIGLVLMSMGCPPQGEGQQSPTKSEKGKQPKLVVGIVVDQMRYDYLTRFAANFCDGGFKRLLGEGTTFDNCNYNYVPTETAPGHASIFTGTSPSGHGIIMNDWLDQSDIAKGLIRTHSSVQDSMFPLVGVPKAYILGRGAAPLRLDATTIADQMKAASKGQAKTIGVSLKDRSAILPVGKSADIAFWFEDLTGNMVSSTYYPGAKGGLPKWVDSLNALHIPTKYLSDPAGWTLLLPAERYSAPDEPTDSRYEGTYADKETPTFPHKFKVDPVSCCAEFKSTAWGNTIVKDFAKEVIRHYQLGEDGVSDFLSVSFSSTDMVAHQFGIESREVEDTYLRLDRDLADFLSFLDARLGKENVLVFLTADHGGAQNPTYAQDHGQPGGWLEIFDLNKKIHSALGDQRGKDSLLTAVKGHTVYLNRKLAARRNLNLDSLCKVVVAAIQGAPGIEKAYTAAEVAAMHPTEGGEVLLKNGFYPERSGDVLYLASYGYLAAPYAQKEAWRYKKGTSHGTHYEYDTHVPLLWWGGLVPHNAVVDRVEITDIAPTACSLMGIAPTSKTKGKVLLEGK